MLRSRVLFIFLIALFFSCKTVHKTKTRVEGVRTSRSELLEKLKQPDFNFKWFSAKAKIEFDDLKNNQTATANIRMKKDSAIWISITGLLGIEGTRILITPDSIKLLDKLNSRYYKKDISYLKQITNMTNLTFDNLQKIILGIDFNFDKSNSTVEKIDTTYKIETSEKQLQSIIWLNAMNLTMSKKELKDKVINQTYEMNYADYRLLADRLFSYRRKVKIVGQQDKTYSIDIDYKKVTLDEPQKMPFTVPKSYEIVK